jgi:hypothetical protein
MQPRAGGDGRRIGEFVPLLGVEMDGGGDNLVPLKPVESCLRTLRQQGQARSRLARRPFEQRVVAAADDRGRRLRLETLRSRQTGGHPAVQRCAREQPFSGDLGTGHGALRHELVELALLELEIGRRLVSGQVGICLHNPA